MGVLLERRAIAARRTYEALVLSTPGLISFYRFNEPSGTVAVDGPGTNDGTYAGTVSLAAAGATSDGDKAVAVAGAGTAVLPIDLSALAVVTVEFFLKWTSYLNNYGMAVEYSGVVNTNSFYVTLDAPSGVVQVALWDGTAQTKVEFARPTAGVYHHHAIVLDRTKTAAAGAVVAYCDGVALTPTFTSGLAQGGTFGNFNLYAMSRIGTSLFGTGSIDDLAIYSGALSADTIKAHSAGR